MARQARIVLPDTPHHIMQRGSEGENIFFEKDDLKTYLSLLAQQCKTQNVSIWSYCLLPNQIHLIAFPQTPEGLAQAIGETHRRYSAHINARTGHKKSLFQSRFFSYPMDERSLLSAARFIEILPVMAGVAPSAECYLWSSARAHIKNKADILLAKEKPLIHFMPDWSGFLNGSTPLKENDDIELHLQTGRPRGADDFLDSVEKMIGRPVRPQKRGRKPKQSAAA